MSERITEIVRRAVREAPSRYRLALDSKLAFNTIYKLCRGQDVRSTTLDKICEVLGLTLVPIKREGREVTRTPRGRRHGKDRFPCLKPSLPRKRGGR